MSLLLWSCRLKFCSLKSRPPIGTGPELLVHHALRDWQLPCPVSGTLALWGLSPAVHEVPSDILWCSNTKDNVHSLSLAGTSVQSHSPHKGNNYLGKKEILTQKDTECFHCIGHLIAFKTTTKSQLSFLWQQMGGIWHHVHNVFPGKRLKVCFLSYLLEERKRNEPLKFHPLNKNNNLL